ncbi:MAG: aspartate kinase [Candidatus Thorarchaeota archaeon]|nr:aspartate kinase [Candidatus Thorarchaeota archaeon]
MKFGGGCLRTPKNLTDIASIVRKEMPNPIVIVVSAFNGVTNDLEAAAQTALESEDRIPEVVKELRIFHQEFVESIIDDQGLLLRTLNQVESKFQKLERLLFGVAYTGEISDAVRILIMSQGERLSSIILEAVLINQGIQAKAFESEALGIQTDSVCDNATANLRATKQNLTDQLTPFLQKGIIPVITGFFGCTTEGKTSSFGRNGSDYSAAVVAYALNAESVHIWKDVDGFMSADPRIVQDSVRIDTLSYVEAAELSYFGAKILHPRTVEPLAGTGVKIFIHNIHAPENSVTVIQPEGHEKSDVIKSVTANDDIAVLKIHGAGVGHKPGIIGEIGRTLSGADVNIFSVLTSQTSISLILDSVDSGRGVDALRHLVGGVIERIELKKNVSLIAVVGEGLLTTEGLAARVFTAVAEHGINVEMFAAGASEVAYYFIVEQSEMKTAIQAVHEKFFGAGSIARLSRYS